MFPLKIIPDNTTIPFLRFRFVFFVISVVLILLSLGGFAIKGLNTGIDFKGGFLIEVRNTIGDANINDLRASLESLDLGDVSLQEFGSQSDVLIRVQSQTLDESTSLTETDKAAIARITTALGDNYEIRRTEFVGAVVGGELRRKAALAVLASIVGILIYIWFRFEWPFAVCAVLALAHDVISTIGLFALTGLEFNLATVAALLTIAGYSINDTVVVFDRVRDNLRKYKSHPVVDILTRALNETLSRTVMTSLTTLIALVAIFIFGGAVLADFALAMIWGVIIGTYSSIFVAVSALLWFNLKPVEDETTPRPEYEK